MIGYTTVGTNDLEKSGKFYDDLFSVLGAKRVMEMDGFIAWTTGEKEPLFAVIKPHDGQPATVGNGVMISLKAENPEMVDKLYAKAMSLGSKDEGAAGPRGETFYAGYFRDLEGNKLNIFCQT